MNDILDLRFKKKISNTIIDDFRIISNSNIKNFFKLIDNESKLNHDNLDWWVSSASTRNTIISPLYHNYCILVLLKNKNEIYFKTFDKIITNSNIIYKFLIKKYPYLKNKILIKTKYKKMERIHQSKGTQMQAVKLMVLMTKRQR